MRLPSVLNTPGSSDPSAKGDAKASTRVLIADDHPMVREVLTLACEMRPSLSVVGQAGNGFEALERSLELQPDVIVLDLLMPGLDGLGVIKRLREQGGSMRILVISGMSDRSAVFECVRAGADGFLEKSEAVEQIAAAVEAVASGMQIFSVDQQRAVHARLGDIARRSREAAQLSRSLTTREREVLELIVAALTTRQIASRLKISERTAETHIRNLYRKLGVRTRVQAAHRALSLRMIDPIDAVGTRYAAGR